jgi:retinol dehydrogenase 12
MSVGTIYSQMFPPKPQWSVEEIPDLTGKIVMVTGGNTVRRCPALLMDIRR